MRKILECLSILNGCSSQIWSEALHWGSSSRQKSHLHIKLCSFIRFLITWKTTISHIKRNNLTINAVERILKCMEMQPHGLIHTCLQNLGDFLSGIPEGLAFPGKSWSHIRECKRKGACGLQQISSHFPPHTASPTPHNHTLHIGSEDNIWP